MLPALLYPIGTEYHVTRIILAAAVSYTPGWTLPTDLATKLQWGSLCPKEPVACANV